MTTRTQAETVLFTDVVQSHNETLPDVPETGNETICTAHNEPAETSTNVDKPDRRRVDATYCPLCQGWVEVRLHPVRLHCTGCGQEARP